MPLRSDLGLALVSLESESESASQELGLVSLELGSGLVSLELVSASPE
jgi:hypothetical protein